MDATKFCDYSQEYLSLRARRGKLRAIKNGRNWFTTKEWLDEYIEKTEQYKEELIKKTREKEIFFKINAVPFSIEANVIAQKNVFATAVEAFPAVMMEEPAQDNSNPPENLPIENINFSKIKKHDKIISVLKTGFLFGMIIGVTIGALAFNKIALGNFIAGTYSFFEKVPASADYAVGVFGEYFSWLGSGGIYMEGAQKFIGLANGLKILINYISIIN